MPGEHRGADPAPTGIVGDGDRFDLRVRQHRRQAVPAAAREPGEPGDDRARGDAQQRADDLAITVPRDQRQGQLARRPLKLPGCSSPHEPFPETGAGEGVQQPRPALPTSQRLKMAGFQIIGCRLQQRGHRAGLPRRREPDPHAVRPGHALQDLLACQPFRTR
ncbi:hypothetical protein [Streptomyces humi]